MFAPQNLRDPFGNSLDILIYFLFFLHERKERKFKKWNVRQQPQKNGSGNVCVCAFFFVYRNMWDTAYLFFSLLLPPPPIPPLGVVTNKKTSLSLSLTGGCFFLVPVGPNLLFSFSYLLLLLLSSSVR